MSRARPRLAHLALCREVSQHVRDEDTQLGYRGPAGISREPPLEADIAAGENPGAGGRPHVIGAVNGIRGSGLTRHIGTVEEQSNSGWSEAVGDHAIPFPPEEPGYALAAGETSPAKQSKSVTYAALYPCCSSQRIKR